MSLKKIFIGVASIVYIANASSNNVASLTDVKEAVHFLLKDYGSQQTKTIELEKKLNSMENSIMLLNEKMKKDEQKYLELKNKYEKEKSTNIGIPNTSTVNKNTTELIRSADDKIILDYLEKRKQ